MGRRDEYDDEDDDRDRRPAKRGGLPPGVWVLLGVAVVGAVMLAVGLVVSRVERQQQQAEPIGKQYSRDEFRKLVVGKSTDEVLAAIGKPESTSSSSPQHQLWVYRYITVDPVTKEPDFSALVTFRNGKATDVSY